MNIVWLTQAECRNQNLVGNKAANLSRLYANHLIPPGFCITVEAVSKYMNSIQLDENMTDPAVLPSPLYTELETATQSLSRHCGEAETAVAVRSSAVDEDTNFASFAGQYKTYLNVTGVDSIAAAAMGCLRSVSSTRALEYRRLRGLPLDDIQLAVLVQRQIFAQSAAVVFSVDPLNGLDEIIINSAWGLGKSVVDGLVTPDTHVVRKSDLKIISRHIAMKHIMTVPHLGGTLEVESSSTSRSAPALNDRQVIELARTAIQLEEFMGWPVDVECAYERENLYLLQCRPVTVRGNDKGLVTVE